MGAARLITHRGSRLRVREGERVPWSCHYTLPLQSTLGSHFICAGTTLRHSVVRTIACTPRNTSHPWLDRTCRCLRAGRPRHLSVWWSQFRPPSSTGKGEGSRHATAVSGPPLRAHAPLRRWAAHAATASSDGHVISSYEPVADPCNPFSSHLYLRRCPSHPPARAGEGGLARRKR